MKWLITLALATLASEDLTCITAGQLTRLGHVSAAVAIAGCFVGIYFGDLMLWLAGRLLRHWNFVERRIQSPEAERFGQWFDRNSAAAILASRFIPGSRLPMYLAAGALGRNPLAFAGWTFVAAILWTPLVVLSIAALGDALAGPLEALFGHSGVVLVIAIAAGLLLLNLSRLLMQDNLPARLIASISRTWRWEFWPAWLFYLPLVPWIAWLALRHRSFMVITAANPGIPHGGIVGESKHQILEHLRGPHVLSARLVSHIDDLTDATFPLVLKPDAGQRGAGVRIVRSIDDAHRYLADTPGPIIAQQYHPGPHEAGIFYYRLPGEPRGHIFSITDKQFPVLIGDGVHTFEQLIWRHERFRMQAGTFLARHHNQLDRVLATSETLQLARAGNHCQGTMFRDGSHLITPQLEAAIDRIAQSGEGLFFGRFDVRYSDVAALKAGEDFAIVEFNGVASESTNLYDPRRSLFWAYRTLFRQWSVLFEVGATGRRRGFTVSRLRDVIAEVVNFYRAARPGPLSD